MKHFVDIDNTTLVEECKAGNREAMSLLYTRFAPRMLHVITRYVSNKEDAYDILHDGFIAAFSRLDSLREPERLDYWLATIMKNLSLKFLQAQTVASILDELPEEIEDNSEIDDIIDFATIEYLIKQLPEGYQKVFRLAVLENKSHKEISEILGIAPNSSSSQLFHAKLRMRELIRDYRLRAGLISLMILIASSGLIILYRKAAYLNTQADLQVEAGSKKRISNSHSRPTPTSPASVSYTKTSLIRTSSIKMISTQDSIVEEQISAPQLPIISDTEAAITSDSTSVATPNLNKTQKPSTNSLDEDYDIDRNRLFADTPRKPTSGKGWSAGILFEPGMLSFNGMLNGDLGEVDSNDPSHSQPQPPQEPDEDKENTSTPSRIPRAAEGIENYLSTATPHHHLPISFTLTAEKHFSSWLGLETGIGYSYLHTDFERYNPANKKNDVSSCHWHYLEIPLKVNLYAYTSPRMKLYFGFGGRVAIPVYSYANIAPNPYCQSGGFNSKAVWSAGGSVGVAFRLSKRIDLFIEPSLRYNFPQDAKIPNIWTDDEPWSLSIPIGFRFNW